MSPNEEYQRAQNFIIHSDEMFKRHSNGTGGKLFTRFAISIDVQDVDAIRGVLSAYAAQRRVNSNLEACLHRYIKAEEERASGSKQGLLDVERRK